MENFKIIFIIFGMIEIIFCIFALGEKNNNKQICLHSTSS